MLHCVVWVNLLTQSLCTNRSAADDCPAEDAPEAQSSVDWRMELHRERTAPTAGHHRPILNKMVLCPSIYRACTALELDISLSNTYDLIFLYVSFCTILREQYAD